MAWAHGAWRGAIGLLPGVMALAGCFGDLSEGADPGIDEAIDPSAEQRALGAVPYVCNTQGLGLRQRSQPDKLGVIIAVLPEGAATQVIEQRGSWYLNRRDGIQGWSYGKYLCSSPPDPASSSSSSPEPPSLGPAVPRPGTPTDPVEEDDEEPAPQPSTRLSVTEIVGGGYSVTQPYGPTEYDYDYSYCADYGAGTNVHCGVDIGLKRGRPLHAPDRATVLVAGGTIYFTDAYNPAAGQLTMKLEDGTNVIFGHMSEINVQKGQTVARGQLVGLSGQGGTWEENGHLHLEVRVPDSGLSSGLRTVDPIDFFGQ